MQAAEVTRAVNAAMSIAASLGLEASDAVVLHNSNKLAVRLRPCEVFARVALQGRHVAPFEVELARRLAEAGSPVAALEPRVAPRPYERDGYAVTFWTYYRAAGEPAPADYARALLRLHAGMRAVDLPAPHFTDRIAEAEQILADAGQSPALADSDRELLGGALATLSRTIADRGAREQLLHGEPHPGNVLATKAGPRFIDLETCCRGPVEFDLAHAPEAVAAHYPGADQDLLDDCRGLVLAMVAAWRWEAGDQFPDGRRWGEELIRTIRKGPPWPTLGALSSPA